MPDVFKRILIIHKRGHEPAAKLAPDVQAWLHERNIICAVSEAGEKFDRFTPDCVVVLGGDGTILGVARGLAGAGTPIFGINFGAVGFLTAADAADWQKPLRNAMDGKVRPHDCMALRWRVESRGKTAFFGAAVNDVVISRGNLARLMAAHIKINGEDFGISRGDGLIICSPLGSSGYNISAGGPLLYANMEAIALTPICPFKKNFPPLVCGGASEMEFRIEPCSADCHITIDGQEGRKLNTYDVVKIGGWPGATRLFIHGGGFTKRFAPRGLALENTNQNEKGL